MRRLGRWPWRAVAPVAVATLLVLPIFLTGHLHDGELPVSPTCATCKAVHPVGIEAPKAKIVRSAASTTFAVRPPTETFTDAPLRSSSTSRGPPAVPARTIH